MLALVLSFIALPQTPLITTFAQPTSTENMSNSTPQQSTAMVEPGGADLSLLEKINATLKKEPAAALEIKMAQLSSSDKPEDIATLAYIWGYSPISMERSFNWFTNPKAPMGTGHGPANTLNCVRELLTPNDTDVVLPNADTLYCMGWMDLSKEPLVLKVPAIPDRYYTFEFLDAYTNVYSYVGTRATGSSGGTYLIAGPQWKGEVPEGMVKIWSPTNLSWILERTLLKGTDDMNNVHAIQDQMNLSPLSQVSQGNTSGQGSTTNASWTSHPASFVTSEHLQNPVSPKPPFIPTTGIKIYDEIGTAMTGNPLNPPEPPLVTKFASIGIGPGMTPSTQANDTIKQALETGIQEGEKLISAQVPVLGTLVNGWTIASAGLYGTDYLFRAGVTKLGLGANIGQEAIYPPAFTDIEGKQLSGSNNYTIHFDPGQLPPVDAFWSISMYNNESYFVDNPINRYVVGQYTEGLKNNTDGSLDIYIQHDSPGADRESNWLPSTPPNNDFKLTLRLYLPQEPILNGTWTPPTIQRTNS